VIANHTLRADSPERIGMPTTMDTYQSPTSMAMPPQYPQRPKELEKRDLNQSKLGQHHYS